MRALRRTPSGCGRGRGAAVGVALGCDVAVAVGVRDGTGVAEAVGIGVKVEVGGGVLVGVRVDVATGSSPNGASSAFVSVAVGETDTPSAMSAKKAGMKAVLMTSPKKPNEPEPVERTGEEYFSEARVSRRVWRLVILALVMTAGVSVSTIVVIIAQPDARRATPIWAKEFAQDAEGWQIDAGDVDIDAGRLILRPLDIGSAALALHNLPVEDFILETQVAVIDGSNDNGYGIVVGNAGQLTAFLVSGDGYFGVMRRESGVWFERQAWRQWPHVRRDGASNTLLIECGAACLFYINDEVTARVEVERPRTIAGLAAWRYAAPPLAEAFDSVRAWAY